MPKYERVEPDWKKTVNGIDATTLPFCTLLSNCLPLLLLLLIPPLPWPLPVLLSHQPSSPPLALPPSPPPLSTMVRFWSSRAVDHRFKPLQFGQCIPRHDSANYAVQGRSEINYNSSSVIIDSNHNIALQ